MRPSMALAIAFHLGFLGASAASAQKPEEGEPSEPTPTPQESQNVDDAPAVANEEPPISSEEGSTTQEAKPKSILPGDEVNDSEPEPTLIAAAPDTRRGHVMISPLLAVVLPFGKIESGSSQSAALGAGPGLALDVGLGVSRSVVVGAWGQLFKLNEGDDCSTCSATSLGIGAFWRYHLVQGLRFDPWLAVGAGFRWLTLELPVSDASYSGIEFLRLQLGGDWYPTSSLGFGPVLELDSGIYTNRPTSANDAAVHLQFLAGLRVTLDLPGR